MTNDMKAIEELSSLQEDLRRAEDAVTSLRSQRDAEIWRLVNQGGFSRYRIARLLGMSESAIKKIVDARMALVFDEVHTLRDSVTSRAILDAQVRAGRQDPEVAKADQLWSPSPPFAPGSETS